jgi:hypothetical protein
MTLCLDCGSELKEKPEGEAAYVAPPQEAEPPLPPGEYAVVTDGLSATAAESLVRLFVESGIPVKVGTIGHGLCLSCRAEDRPAVVTILEREGVIPAQPDSGAPAVAAAGGPCPACSTHIGPGILQCPECGLQLGGTACDRCGAELPAGDEACPGCGREPS